MLNINVIALTQGNPLSKKSFSGTNYRLISALKSCDALAGCHDVEHYGLSKYMAAALVFSFDNQEWRHNFRINPYSFFIRSMNAKRILSHYSSKELCVLQIGAQFASSRYSHFPVFSYHDNTAALSLRGGEYSFSNFANQSFKNKVLEREKKVYEENAGIFVFSEHVKSSMHNDFGISKDKIHVVYCGINIKANDDEYIPINKFSNKTILFVGKDFKRKGGEDLLKAFLIVKKSIPNANLIIVGSEPNVNIDGVTVRGFIDQDTNDGVLELIDLYRNASIFCMPSHFEPFGIPFCEAMYFRTPCVGTCISSIPELIIDGKNGFTVHPKSPETLANRLLLLLSDENRMREMGEVGHALAVNKFDWSVVANKMINIMSNTIS
jgi:glycosyltransferase involved in cell wall biosynthesis